MASDFSRLLRQDFSELEAGEQAWNKLGGQLDGLHNQHRSKVSGPLASSWQGDDADFAQEYFKDVEKRMSTESQDCERIARALADTRRRMEQAQRKLRDAVKGAEADHFEVGEDGSLRDPSSDRLSPDDPDAERVGQERRQAMQNYHNRFQQAVDEACQASNEGAKQLAGLSGGKA